MRVAVVTPAYGCVAGGVGRHVQELARRAAAAGHEVEVLVHGLEAHPAAAGDGSVTVRHFPPGLGGGDFAVSQPLWEHLRLRGGDYDLVHAHGYRTLPALLATRDALRRLVFTPHWHRAPTGTRVRRLVSPFYRRLGVPAMEAADLVLCASAAEAAAVLRLVPDAEPRLHVVPDGIDAAALRAARPADDAPFDHVILSPTRGQVAERAERLISALPALPAGVGLAVMGDGAAVGTLRAHAADLRVGGRVRFLGRLDDDGYHRWLQAASVVVSMDERALTATPLVEARALGLPVVAADTPLHREVAELVEGRGVRLVAGHSSPLALADELLAAAQAPRGAATRVPTWDTVAEITLALYARCVVAARPTPGLVTPPVPA